ncbi:MAG: glycyl-radical enzyme activating protein [Mangrovibacterium sp.]|nr:glycyl-radical enzyme activating protein [Mangrovibacterium sp.]
MKALLTDICPLSTHDGPGLRTTVFFKGCPLRCIWCHNPETQQVFPETGWDRSKCIGCKSCEAACPHQAIDLHRAFPVDKTVCKNCGECVKGCPSSALFTMGKTWSVDELYNQLLKDEIFIKRSNGGVTFSGGEPAMQYRFIEALAIKLKRKKFHLALDTCGMAPKTAFKTVLPYMDLVLFDLKEMDERKHYGFTGVKNGQILKTLIFIHQNFPFLKIWIRTPVIPGMTGTEENIRSIGKFITANLSGQVEKWELCAFNNLCAAKYDRLGLTWSLRDTALLNRRQADQLLQEASLAACRACAVSFSGLTLPCPLT